MAYGLRMGGGRSAGNPNLRYDKENRQILALSTTGVWIPIMVDTDLPVAGSYIIYDNGTLNYNINRSNSMNSAQFVVKTNNLSGQVTLNSNNIYMANSEVYTGYGFEFDHNFAPELLICPYVHINTDKGTFVINTTGKVSNYAYLGAALSTWNGGGCSYFGVATDSGAKSYDTIAMNVQMSSQNGGTASIYFNKIWLSGNASS